MEATEKTNIENTVGEKIDWLKELPDDPQKITFPERYSHVDREILNLIKEKNSLGRQVKVLDFGCGILKDGSPTTIDLANEIEKGGGKPAIFAVDNSWPDGFSGNDSRINYFKEIPRGEGDFDVVRMLHVAEHVKDPLEFKKLREDLVSRLKEGGFFVTTQYFYEVYGRDFVGPKTREAGNIIKILQKEKGELRLVTLIPDGSIGWNNSKFSDIEEYLKFRNDVISGDVKLDNGPREENFNIVVNNLTGSGITLKDIDRMFSTSEISNLYSVDKEESNLNEISQRFLNLFKNRKEEAAKYFIYPKRKTLFGWKS